MQLLASWRDSLTLFKPSALKLFSLVTLKSIKDTYPVWLKYWWWLIVGIGISAYVVQQPLDLTIPFFWWGPDTVHIDAQYGFSKTVAILLYMLFMVLISTLVLCARPSVFLKNYKYIASFWFQILCVFFWFFGVIAPGSKIILFTFSNAHFSAFFGFIFLGLMIIFLTFLTLFFLFFLFDSDNAWWTWALSIRRAFKMVLFNLPLCLIVGIFLLVLYVFISFCIHMPVFYLLRMYAAGNTQVQLVVEYCIVQLVEFVLVAPLFVCTVNNIYVKRMHEQFALYYKEKE